MFRVPVSLFSACVAVFVGVPLGAAPQFNSAALNRLPLLFEQNRGQAPQPVRFIARGPNYRLEVEPASNILVWTDGSSHNSASLRTEFAGANPRASVHAEDPAASVTNYLIGSSSRGWLTGIPNFRRIRIDGIYRGIDLLFHGEGGDLEYDFIVNPRADPHSISFLTHGAKHVRLSKKGDLLLSTGAGEVRWKKPEIYQDSQRGRIQIRGGFQLARNGRVRFWLGEYDRAKPLVIDPSLLYASYFGAPPTLGVGFQSSRGIGVDAAGNVYIAGNTASGDLPVTAGTVQTAFGGLTVNLRYLEGDAFVAKFTSQGALSYMTYLGGSGDDAAFGLAVDTAGNAYVTGMTNSSNFPVTDGVLQSAQKGSGGNSCARFGDAFVAKLNPSGTKLVYSTYLGGTRDDFGTAIAIDGQGNAYVSGATLSADFPTVNALYDKQHGAGGEPGRPSCSGVPLFDGGDAFVAALNPSASSLLFSTYLGGSKDDVATAIALDSSQNVYVGGMTLSSDFPVSDGAFQTSFSGVDTQNEFFHLGDGFVAKLSAGGSALAYSTYLGGSGDDAVMAIAVDKAGTAYVAGSTSSSKFPVTANAVQHSYGGYTSLPFVVEQNVGDAFAARLDPKGAALLYSTFLGGSANDGAMGIAVDPSGLIYVTGMTDSSDFRLTSNAVQPAFAGDDTLARITYFPLGDGFLAILDPNLTAPVYSTYFGGKYNDGFTGMALDSSGNIWTVGFTESPDLKATANGYQRSYTGAPPGVQSPSPDTPVAGEAMLAELSTTGAANGPVLNAVENAASNKTSVVSPGMVFVAYGTNLGPKDLTQAAIDPVTGLLSSVRSGTAVLFDNIPAPLVYVSANQLAGTVPYELEGKSTVKVVVEVEGQRSAPTTVQVQPAAPGLFSLDYSGKGQAVAYEYAGQSAPVLNSASNPAPVGSLLVIYATGEGQSDPPGQDGLIANAVVPKAAGQVSVTIGGVPQPDIRYAGAIPGEAPGILQVNLVVAPGTPSGIQPIVVSADGVSSQTGMTVAIQ
ncbi:MAG TPA: SBBP repeat-containing protein [Bryobacteraceae bacterium]|nr:SBBP repeat-containing protein [Bryobacteraceae bacterium]